MRDENDWRPGDKIAQGPDWEGSFYTKCHCCGKPKTWDEYWVYGTAGKWEPIVGRVYRVKGNVIRIVIGKGGQRGNFMITPNGKRYIINPACKNGGYRSSNRSDPKYQTDSQGRFVKSGRRSSHGG